MQTRSWEYRSDDKTIDINQWLLGVIEPGVYRGFNFLKTANMVLNLVQNTTGFSAVRKDLSESAPTGLIISKQGVFIREDSPITLAINPGSSSPRIDLIVCNHQFIEVAGGQQASYSVIQGTPAANPTAPGLTSPKTQVIIGELYLPAGVTRLDAAGVVFTRRNSPAFANNPFDPSGITSRLDYLSREIIANDIDIANLYQVKADKTYVDGWYIYRGKNGDANSYIEDGYAEGPFDSSQPNGAGAGTLFIYGRMASVKVQMYVEDNGESWTRSRDVSGNWSAWRKNWNTITLDKNDIYSRLGNHAELLANLQTQISANDADISFAYTLIGQKANSQPPEWSALTIAGFSVFATDTGYPAMNRRDNLRCIEFKGNLIRKAGVPASSITSGASVGQTPTHMRPAQTRMALLTPDTAGNWSYITLETNGMLKLHVVGGTGATQFPGNYWHLDGLRLPLD